MLFSNNLTKKTRPGNHKGWVGIPEKQLLRWNLNWKAIRLRTCPFRRSRKKPRNYRAYYQPLWNTQFLVCVYLVRRYWLFSEKRGILPAYTKRYWRSSVGPLRNFYTCNTTYGVYACIQRLTTLVCGSSLYDIKWMQLDRPFHRGILRTYN